jgi:[ribosomal protein S18]-alanine N-acetyltransferase
MTLELKAFDGDLDWLWELEQSSFNPADQMSRDELAAFRRDPSNRILLIVEKGTRAGAILLRETCHDVIYLESIAVHSCHRSHGCGARALAILLADLAGEGFRTVRLHVRASNPSRRLYERLGFRVLEEIPSFYDDGESALYMELGENS